MVLLCWFSISLGPSFVLPRKGRESQALLLLLRDSFFLTVKYSETLGVFQGSKRLQVLFTYLISPAPNTVHVFDSQHMFIEYNSMIMSHLLYNYAFFFTCAYICCRYHRHESNQIRPILWDSKWWELIWAICENYRVMKSGPFIPRMKKHL